MNTSAWAGRIVLSRAPMRRTGERRNFCSPTIVALTHDLSRHLSVARCCGRLYSFSPLEHKADPRPQDKRDHLKPQLERLVEVACHRGCADPLAVGDWDLDELDAAGDRQDHKLQPEVRAAAVEPRRDSLHRFAVH